MILQELTTCIIMTPHEAHTFNMRQSSIASFLEKCRSSTSLIGPLAYFQEPMDYYPPGINSTLYRRRDSFRGGHIW